MGLGPNLSKMSGLWITLLSNNESLRNSCGRNTSLKNCCLMPLQSKFNNLKIDSKIYATWPGSKLTIHTQPSLKNLRMVRSNQLIKCSYLPSRNRSWSWLYPNSASLLVEDSVLFLLRASVKMRVKYYMTVASVGVTWCSLIILWVDYLQSFNLSRTMLLTARSFPQY